MSMCAPRHGPRHKRIRFMKSTVALCTRVDAQEAGLCHHKPCLHETTFLEPFLDSAPCKCNRSRSRSGLPVHFHSWSESGFESTSGLCYLWCRQLSSPRVSCMNCLKFIDCLRACGWGYHVVRHEHRRGNLMWGPQTALARVSGCFSCCVN